MKGRGKGAAKYISVLYGFFNKLSSTGWWKKQQRKEESDVNVGMLRPRGRLGRGEDQTGEKDEESN